MFTSSSQTLTTIAETAQPVRDIEWVKKLNRGGQCAQDPTITLKWFYFELCVQVPLRQPEHAWRSSLLCNNCRKHWSDDQQHERSQRCVQRQGMVLKRILLEIHCKWCFLMIIVLINYKKDCCCRSTASKRILCSEKLQRSLKRGWRAAFFKEEKNWSDHRAKLPQDDQLVPVPLGQQPVWRWTRDPLSLTSEGSWEWDLWGCPTI